MTTINLLPWRIEKKKEIQRKFFINFSSAILITLTIMAIIHIIITDHISKQNNINIKIKKEIQFLDEKMHEIEKLKKQITQLSSRIKLIQTLQINRTNIVRLFDELPRMLPNGVYITTMQRERNLVTLIGQTESNIHLSNIMQYVEKSDWLSLPILKESKKNIFLLQFLQNDSSVKNNGV